MGRVGRGAYDNLRERLGDKVVGVDLDDDLVEGFCLSGRRVINGSAADPDFWARFHLDPERVSLVLLALPNQTENLFAVRQLRELGFDGHLAAIAKYPDEVDALREAGVDSAFNLYAEAGAGFADDVCNALKPAGQQSAGQVSGA